MLAYNAAVSLMEGQWKMILSYLFLRQNCSNLTNLGGDGRKKKAKRPRLFLTFTHILNPPMTTSSRYSRCDRCVVDLMAEF